VAILSPADFWRQTNSQTKELARLEKAMISHTNFADVLYQYSLYWVRKRNVIEP
jgi:hypothetical protein